MYTYIHTCNGGYKNWSDASTCQRMAKTAGNWKLRERPETGFPLDPSVGAWHPEQ